MAELTAGPESAPAPAPSPVPPPASAPPAPTPSQTPEPTPLTASTPPPFDWRAQIKSDEGKKFAESSTDIDHLVQRGLDMRSKLSGALFKPGKNAKPEDIAAWNKALNVPDTADGYKYAPAEEFKAEYEAPEAQERLKAFYSLAHQHGASAEMVKGILDWRNAEMVKDREAQVAADKKFADATETENKKLWGPDYDRNHELANRFVDKTADTPEDLAAFKKLEMKDGRFVGDHPLVQRMFAKAGRMTNEDALGPVPMTGSDMESAKAKLEDLTAQQADAQAAGKDALAKQLDGEIMKQAERISGNRPYVGPEMSF